VRRVVERCIRRARRTGASVMKEYRAAKELIYAECTSPRTLVLDRDEYRIAIESYCWEIGL